MLLALVFSVLSYIPVASAGWHNLSQYSRNQLIVDRAFDDVDTYVGESCKEWARTVIQGASSGAVTIPSNSSSQCSWYSHPYTIGYSGYLEWASVGHIIQMKLNNGTPHTAIIAGTSPYGVTVVESNWCQGGCNEVGLRYWSFANFYSSVQCFSLYYIQ
jgi:hypothetical protein